jgi:hypothetical protein
MSGYRESWIFFDKRKVLISGERCLGWCGGFFVSVFVNAGKVRFTAFAPSPMKSYSWAMAQARVAGGSPKGLKAVNPPVDCRRSWEVAL